MSSKEMQKTLKLLMKMPMYKQLVKDNKVLNERVRSLEYAIQYLESKNAKLEKKLNKKNKIINLTEEDDGNISIVIEESEETIGLHDEIFVVEETKKKALDELIVKYPDYEKHKEEKIVVVEEINLDEGFEEEEAEAEEEEAEEVEAEEVEAEEVEAEEEEAEEEEAEGEEAEEEEAEGEEAEGEEAEEEEAEGEEAEEEEAEGEEAEEEEAEEEEAEEEEAEGEEAEEEEAEEEEGDGVYEVEINGKSYYVANEIDSIIYEADDEGEITIEAGVYKNGKPVFN
jgi:type IV secretory pathway VirB10-like protein